MAQRGHRVVVKEDLGYLHSYRPNHLINLHPAGLGEEWIVHNNSLENLERALVERVFTVKGPAGTRVAPPAPKPNLVRSRLKEFRRLLVHQVGRVQPWSTKEFVDSYTCSRKRRVYQSAADSLEVTPLDRRDVIISPFVKAEKANVTRKADPAPRVISPATPRFNITIGKHLKPMEKRVFAGVHRLFRGDTVMKGLNADERGVAIAEGWSGFNNAVAILLDASRFDQHISIDVIDWEHGLWEALAVDRDELRRLNKMRRVNTMIARAGGKTIKAELRGVRMSGAMDTALGNCTTMCAMTWSFMRDIGVSNYRYFNDGDDGVLIVERDDEERVLSAYEAYFLELGFTMKLEGLAYELEHIDFCQSRPVLTSEGTYRMIRDPRVCLGKDSLAVVRALPAEGSGYHHAQANALGWCGLALAGDMPVFNAFYGTMATASEPDRSAPNSGMQFMARGLDAKFTPPHGIPDDVRLSFYKAFDITPDDQYFAEIQLFRDATGYEEQLRSCSAPHDRTNKKSSQQQLYCH